MQIRLTGMAGHRLSYAWCREWRVLPAQVKKRLAPTRQAACWYLRIAKLPLDLGSALDAAGASFRRLRYVAFGAGRVEQERRFEEVMARLAKRDARMEDGE